jgi:Tfp pilus assembly protein PilF
MSPVTLRISVLLSALTLMACATHQDRDTAPYFDAAYNDHNRAPASMAPPAQAADLSSNLSPASVQAQADYHFAAGEAYSFDGLHSKAIESFKTVLIYDPESVQVRLRLAAEYVKMGSMAEALRQAEEAQQKDPNRVETHLLLGGLHSSLKNYPKAISEYDRALKLDPKNQDALMYLGAVYAERKEFDRAVRYFETLASDDDYTTPHTAYYYIGRIREDQGTKPAMKAAEAAYKKALEMKSDYVEAAIALCGFYMKAQKTSQAIEVMKKFQRDHGPNLRVADVLSSLYLQEEKYDSAMEQLEILEADPEESLNVKVKIALIYIDQKKYSAAAVKLNEVLKVAPDSDKIRFYLAAVYEEMGQGLKAAEHFRKVPASSQYYQDSIVHAAYLLRENKKTSDAISLVKEALKERKDIPQFYAVYASLMDDQGDVDNALALLNEGVAKFPDYVQLRFFLGTLHDRKGNKEKSIEQMEKVIEMDPNHVQGLNYLAFTYADMGVKLEEAEQLVKRALEMEPKDGYILDTYGWVLFKQNKLSESVRVLESAHQNQPNESIISEHLGDAYYRSQLLDKARRMYEKAAESSADSDKVKEIRSKITAIEKQEVVGFGQRQPASLSKPESNGPSRDK